MDVDLPWRVGMYHVGVVVVAGYFVLSGHRTNVVLCTSGSQCVASNARLVSPHHTPVNPGLCPLCSPY